MPHRTPIATRWLFAAMLAGLGLGLPVAAAPREEVTTTEAWLRGPGTKAPPEEQFGARARLAKLYVQGGNRKRAEAIWLDVTKAWAAGNFAKDGGAVATVTAEAWFRLLEPKHQAFVARRIEPPPKGPAEKQIAALRKQFLAMVEVAIGKSAQVTAAAGDDARTAVPRAGGLYDEYRTKVGELGSTDWWFAAEVYRARLLEHLADSIAAAPVPIDLAADEQETFRGILAGYAQSMEAKAVKALSLAWAAARERGATNPWVTSIKKNLNRYRPDEVPLSRERARVWLDPVPDDATRTVVEATIPLDAARHCFDRILAAGFDEMLGSVEIRLEVAPDGRLSQVGSSGLEAAYTACLQKAWQGVKGLAPGAAVRTLAVRIDFIAL
ncbi:MAG: hypothetical protein EXR79_13835 [Myxococcales bacterium]|nr:hypothetical protein [Myxococcales bacterium]